MNLLVLLACINPDLQNKKGIGQLTDAEGEESDPHEGSDPLLNSGLPSLEIDEGTQMCDELSDEVGGAAGAKSYFSGIYLRTESGWLGREKWILFPTELWEATEGEPCEVVWESQGDEGNPLTCLACSRQIPVVVG